MVCDQGDYRAIDAMVNAVAERYGRVDTTIEIDGGMLPGVLYDAGLKTITDLL
jgi:hypothetical protein